MADYGAEYAAARQTLELSGRVAENYVRMLGAIAPRNILLPGHLGTRTGFQKTVLTDRYWFAKLYELITYFEIRDRTNFTHPGFVMHFIPVFYDLYYQALQKYETGGKDQVPTMWRKHFDGLQEGGKPVSPGSMDGVRYSIVTGVTSHVQGDMAKALEIAYKTWKVNPKPPFADLKDDFFDKNRPTFESAKASFFLDLHDKGPSPFRPEVAQMLIGTGEKIIGGGLNIDEVYKWRETAWNVAAGMIAASSAIDAALKGAAAGGARGN